MAEALTSSRGNVLPQEAEESGPSNVYQPRKAWTIAIWLTAFSAINFLDKVVLGMLAVPIMEDFHLTPTSFGVIAGSFFWLFSLSAVVVGFIGNRVASRWILLCMAFIWSVVQLPVAFATKSWVLLASRVALGAGEGPSFPVSAHALFKWFPHDKRNLPVTLINQGAVIGLLLAGLLVPYVSHNWGWRTNFIMLAIASAVWGLGWLCFGREGTLSSAAADDGAPRADTLPRRVPYRKLLTDPTILSACFVGFTAYWSLALVLTWIPSYLEQALGFDRISAGKVFALQVAAGIPISMTLSWLSQRMLQRGASTRVARVLFGAVCVGVGGLGLLVPAFVPMPTPYRLVLLTAAATLPNMVFSFGPAILAEITPDAQRSAIVALNVAVSTCAGAIAPITMGWFVQAHPGDLAHGYELGFALGGAVMLTGFVMSWLGQHPERSLRRLQG
ncbi:MAG: MFS transporter [Pseudomonadota bacterium]